MKTIDIGLRELTIQEVLQFASEDNIVLRTPEGRKFLVVELDDFEQEIELTRQNQELMELLDQRSKETSTYTLSQVRAKLKLTEHEPVAT